MTEIEARKWAIETLLKVDSVITKDKIDLMIYRLTDSGRIKFEESISQKDIVNSTDEIDINLD
jgi:hypothetical protein